MGDKRNPTTGWLLVLTVLILSLFALNEAEDASAAKSRGLWGLVMAPGDVMPAAGAAVHLRSVVAGGQSYELSTDELGFFDVKDDAVSGEYRVEIEWRNALGKLLRFTDLATFESLGPEPLRFVLTR